MVAKRGAKHASAPQAKRRSAKSRSGSSKAATTKPFTETVVSIDRTGPYWRYPFRPVQTDTDQALADEMHRLSFQLSRHIVWPKALAGERAATLQMIEKCSEAVRDGSPLTKDVADWLANALLHIARGDTVEEAFNIAPRPRGKGKEGHDLAERPHRYWIAYDAVCRLTLDDEKQVYVFQVLAEKYRKSESTIEGAWKQYRKRAAAEIQMQIEHTGRVMRI